jgi:hypothetical protein
MHSAATVLRGSERIASMLTWNDFGWDGYSKMKEDVAFRLEQAEQRLCPE